MNASAADPPGSTSTSPDAPAARLRVMLVDDSTLFRTGLAVLLTSADLEVVEQLPNALTLAAALRQHRPDVVILDVRMPPTNTDEGLQAALEVRSTHPKIGVLVLSTYAEGIWASRLLSQNASGLGYMLKDRVSDVPALIDALTRVAAGGTAVDPEVISRLLRLNAGQDALMALSSREREVLALMAEGYSNAGIAQKLFLSPRTVEAHVAALFTKLPLESGARAHNRRVLAVLTYLRADL